VPTDLSEGADRSCSGRLLLSPSPPAEKAATGRDQAGQASTGDGAGDRRNSLHGNVIEIDTRVERRLTRMKESGAFLRPVATTARPDRNESGFPRHAGGASLTH
jgi:hypothetical protein